MSSFSPSASVLIVEDHQLIIEFVQQHLQRANIQVMVAETCAEARCLLHKHTPALIVLDVVLDDGSGYDLCQYIRRGGDDGELAHLVDVPILMLTALAEEQARIEGFRSGADDYVTKPFNPDELVLRIQAILRRAIGISYALLEIGPLRIDPRRHEAFLEGQLLDLTPKEFELLHLMASHQGHVFTREDLCMRVWGYSYMGNTRTVDVHINRLRQKLAHCTHTNVLIETEWGIGYKFAVASVC